MVSVLLIEDDPLLRELLRDAMVAAGFTVTDAPNGETGLKLFRADRPDLVVTDIVMDAGEGIGTIMDMHQTDPGVPIIAMSGNPMYLEHSLKLGAAETLQKPFSKEALIAAARALLAKPSDRAAGD